MMPRKPFKPPRIAPLQYVVAEPITDPAERAALDRAHKRAKRKQGGGKARPDGNGSGKGKGEG